MANVRIHGETRKKLIELFGQQKPDLLPKPSHDFDIATLLQLRVSSPFRIAFDSNHYSVPAQYAGARLTLKAYPDSLCIYHEGHLMARHPRSFDRHRDFEDPDHPKPLLAQRQRARDQSLFRRFIALSPVAPDHYRELDKRRINARHHVQKIGP